MTVKLLIVAVLVAGVVCSSALTKSGGAPMVVEQQDQQFVFNLDQLNRQRAESGGPWLEFLNLPSMYCGVYHLTAGSRDGQSPHAEDEVYFVQAGRSKFHLNGEEFDIEPGTVLFVPAHKKHYFHDIAEDLTLLVFFSRGPVAAND